MGSRPRCVNGYPDAMWRRLPDGHGSWSDGQELSRPVAPRGAGAGTSGGLVAGIRELARECGVSVATVSRALNGHPEVSDATRRLVREAAERLGYRPSQSARALVRGRSETVGLLWDTGYDASGRRHPFLLALLVGVKRALSSAGRHLLLLNVDDHRGSDSAYLEVA